VGMAGQHAVHDQAAAEVAVMRLEDIHQAALVSSPLW
jgi:hypothetical protein